MLTLSGGHATTVLVMASTPTSHEVRKQARQRAADAAAAREREARERFELEMAAQRAQAKANENDLAAYYGAENAITDAEQKLADVKLASAVAMADAAQAIAAREGSVSAAARLLDVSPSKLNAIIKAGARAGMEQSGEPSTGDTTTTTPDQGPSGDASGAPQDDASMPAAASA